MFCVYSICGCFSRNTLRIELPRLGSKAGSCSLASHHKPRRQSESLNRRLEHENLPLLRELRVESDLRASQTDLLLSPVSDDGVHLSTYPHDAIPAHLIVRCCSTESNR